MPSTSSKLKVYPTYRDMYSEYMVKKARKVAPKFLSNTKLITLANGFTRAEKAKYVTAMYRLVIEEVIRSENGGKDINFSDNYSIAHAFYWAYSKTETISFWHWLDRRLYDIHINKEEEN